MCLELEFAGRTQVAERSDDIDDTRMRQDLRQTVRMLARQAGKRQTSLGRDVFVESVAAKMDEVLKESIDLGGWSQGW